MWSSRVIPATDQPADAWLRYLDEKAGCIAEIGLPTEVFESEGALSEFLTAGRGAGGAADLKSLPAPQF